MAVFENYSAYYDLLYADKDYAAEVQYIHALIQREMPGAKSILNLGCGTGKHDVLLAELGYEITAIDLSETMIEIALASYPDLSAVHFQVGDVRTFRSEKRFDVVVSLFHVMSYQAENSDLEAAFKTAAFHMKKNGVFLFDCWHGPGVISDKPSYREKVMINENFSIKRYARPEIHPQENCVDVNYEIQVNDASGNHRETILESHRMRYLFQPELALVAKSLHMVIGGSYEWMKEVSPTFDSWNAVYVVRHMPSAT